MMISVAESAIVEAGDEAEEGGGGSGTGVPTNLGASPPPAEKMFSATVRPRGSEPTFFVRSGTKGLPSLGKNES